MALIRYAVMSSPRSDPKRKQSGFQAAQPGGLGRLHNEPRSLHQGMERDAWSCDVRYVPPIPPGGSTRPRRPVEKIRRIVDPALLLTLRKCSFDSFAVRPCVGRRRMDLLGAAQIRNRAIDGRPINRPIVPHHDRLVAFHCFQRAQYADPGIEKRRHREGMHCGGKDQIKCHEQLVPRKQRCELDL